MHQAKESRRGYTRSISSKWEDDEVTLQNLNTHGQMPGKDGKGFGTTTSAWHPEDGEIDGHAEVPSSPLESFIRPVARMSTASSS